ncbi:MAG TPA: hypothetical protein VE527_11650 [Reyranella sp.]|jgi:hypothetical protein|nr:hypothetical protein [Reyranella sp.]
MAPAADDVALCGDDELDYLANQTQFELGQGFLLDEAYRLAHLPLVAPHHPRVIARREGRPYEMGRHEPIFSLVLPIADALLRRSAAYLALEAELKASSLAPKIAWNVVERRRHKLHATLCGSLARGETPPVLDAAQGDALKRLGPVTVELRGLFSGNVNRGRLYLRAYPEKRDGLNMFHRIQQVLGRRMTNLYVVGIYNLTDDLDASECSILSALLARWWDRSIVTFQAEALWLLGASDDLVLGPETAEIVPLI